MIGKDNPARQGGTLRNVVHTRVRHALRGNQAVGGRLFTVTRLRVRLWRAPGHLARRRKAAVGTDCPPAAAVLGAQGVEEIKWDLVREVPVRMVRFTPPRVRQHVLDRLSTWEGAKLERQHAAIRVGSDTQVEERLEHLVRPRGALYMWSARPTHATSCVVICSSLFSDFIANYHRERLLGRALSTLGHAVIRFHYAGEGNSIGERQEMTFSTVRDDAQAVLRYAELNWGGNLAVVGTRLGAIIAAAATNDLPQAPIGLWEPTSDARRFLKEGHRASKMSETSLGRMGPAAESGRPANDGLELFNYDLPRPLLDSLLDVDLVSCLGSTSHPLFLARFRGRAGPGDSLWEELIARGFCVDTTDIHLSESWWFHSEEVPESGDLISVTATWLDQQLRERN